MTDYRYDAPQILRDFLSYHETIKAHSKRTVDEYYLDLRNFFRYTYILLFTFIILIIKNIVERSIITVFSISILIDFLTHNIL